mmetsp:Transcript_13540/g.29083  ORF Transcript_13540/g.29083 Transcript_13540/m.29083 type:complete len:216 (+) Transcript_13540:2487-3134(+)
MSMMLTPFVRAEHEDALAKAGGCSMFGADVINSGTIATVVAAVFDGKTSQCCSSPCKLSSLFTAVIAPPPQTPILTPRPPRASRLPVLSLSFLFAGLGSSNAVRVLQASNSSNSSLSLVADEKNTFSNDRICSSVRSSAKECEGFSSCLALLALGLRCSSSMSPSSIPSSASFSSGGCEALRFFEVADGDFDGVVAFAFSLFFAFIFSALSFRSA